MKKIAMAVLIGLLFCSSTMLAEARSGRTFYSYYETEIKRIDDNTQELLIKITNTTNKPVNNVILLIYTRDTKGIMHEQGFLFLGQLKPNVRKNYSVRIDTPYKLERYDVTPRVLQNDDFQLEEGAVYPVNYFYKYIKIETEDIQHDRGLGYFQGSLTNISSDVTNVQ